MHFDIFHVNVTVHVKEFEKLSRCTRAGSIPRCVLEDDIMERYPYTPLPPLSARQTPCLYPPLEGYSGRQHGNLVFPW